MREQEAGEVVAVLEGLVRALPEVLLTCFGERPRTVICGKSGAHRAGGMRGVSDENDAALVPSWKLGSVVQTILQGR